MSFKALKHFITITKHRHKVVRNCAKAGILWQGLFHDLSKYSLTEFSAGIKFYQGDKSPNEGEREKYGYSKAWMHHKGRNKHHFEYWTDYSKTERRVVPVKMPLKYVIEMFCDRVAASKVYQGKNYTDDHPLEYFLNGKPRRVIHEDTSEFLESLLVMLSQKGEDETFRYIKRLNKNADY